MKLDVRILEEQFMDRCLSDKFVRTPIEELPEEHDYDNYAGEFQISMESSSKKNPKHKEIWLCEFPSFDKHQYRPALIVNPKKSGEMTIVVLGSIKPDDKWKQYPDNVELRDWESEGLEHETYASCNSLYKKKEVTFGRKVGEISDYDYRMILAHSDTDMDPNNKPKDYFLFKTTETFMEIRNTIIEKNPEVYEEFLEMFFPRLHTYSEIVATRETSFVPAGVSEKDIWLCDFVPFDSPRQAVLRCMAIVVFEGNFYAVEIIPEILESDITYVLKDWEADGLEEPSTLVGYNIIPMHQMNFYKRHGHLTDDDYEKCVECIRTARKMKFETPYGFMAWLKSENVRDTTPIDGKNNNNNPLQTIFDIGVSKEANCVDIAMAMRAMCLRKHMKHWIVQSMFIKDEHQSGGHVYCVFEQSRMKFVFRYIPGEYKASQIKNYGGASLEQVITGEVKFLREYWDKVVFKTHTKNVNRVFTEDELKIMDDCVARKTTQRNMLDMLNV